MNVGGPLVRVLHRLHKGLFYGVCLQLLFQIFEGWCEYIQPVVP